MHRILAASVLLAILCLLAPSATAQTFTLTLEWTAERHELPETGKGNVPLTVKAKVANTNCATEAKFSFDLKLASFDKVYGSSMLPDSVTFTLPQGPIMGERELPPQEAVLNLAWNLEDAPRTGAKEDYKVISKASDARKSGGPCLPDPVIADAESGTLDVTMVDRPLEEAEIDCLDDPSQPKCVVVSSSPPDTPGIGWIVVLGLLVGGAWLRRRIAT